VTHERWLLTTELARRWRLSPRTLEGWRLKDWGPPFTRVGRGVRYRLQDIEAFEAEGLRLRDAARRRQP